MSPAVWMLTILQAVMLVSLSLFGGNEAVKPVPGFHIVFSLLIFGFVYLLSGLFRSFATEENIVTVGDAINHGKQAFTPFIWLMLRLLILIFLVLNIFLAISGVQSLNVVKESAKTFALGVSILSFVFIYWLPIVFTNSDFRLFRTLNTALLVAWDRLRQSPFLAFLVLVPALVAWLMPVNIPLPALVGIASINEIATWIAYVYCIEYLIRDKERIVSLLGTASRTKDSEKHDRHDNDQDK